MPDAPYILTEPDLLEIAHQHFLSIREQFVLGMMRPSLVIQRSADEYEVLLAGAQESMELALLALAAEIANYKLNGEDGWQIAFDSEERLNAVFEASDDQEQLLDEHGWWLAKSTTRDLNFFLPRRTAPL